MNFVPSLFFRVLNILPLNLMLSIYRRRQSPIFACAKQIVFSAMALNSCLGVQGFLVLFCYVLLLPSSAQIVTTGNGISVNNVTPATTGVSPGSIAIGSAASSSGINAISIGISTIASGDRSVAIGPSAKAVSLFATALGTNANASENRTVAIGLNASAQAESAIAVGQNSLASQLRATALGAAALSTAIRSTAIGNNAEADRDNASAFGFAAHGYGFNATAIGANSEASGEFSTTFGAQSVATAPFSTAIGAQAIAMRPNQIAIGTNRSNLTIPSLGQGGSFLGAANQNGSTRLLSTDGDGNLGTTNISGSQIEQIPSLESAMYNIGSAMNAGTSIALALSAVPTVSEDPREPVRCGVGTGGYGGNYALGLGCAAKLFNRLQINGGLSYASSVNYGYGATPSIGGRIGFSFPLGVYSPSPSSSAPSPTDTISGSSNGDSRTVIEQLRNDLEQQKQITTKLKQQLEALMGTSKNSGSARAD